MTTQIAVRLADDELAELDEVVRSGRWESRAGAVRSAVRMLLSAERDAAVAEQYRRAYAERPQEEWLAESSALAMGESIAERTPPRRAG